MLDFSQVVIVKKGVYYCSDNNYKDNHDDNWNNDIDFIRKQNL